MDMRSILLSHKDCSVIEGLCFFAVHCLSTLIFGLLARGLAVPLSAMTLFAILRSISVSTMIPFTFAGWGAREGLVIVLLGEQRSTRSDPSSAIVFRSGRPGGVASWGIDLFSFAWPQSNQLRRAALGKGE